MTDSIQFKFAIYLLDKPTVSPSSVLSNELADHFTQLKRVNDIHATPQTMIVHGYFQENVQKEFAPPDLKSLRYFGRGITTAQADALQKSKEVFILHFAHPRKDMWVALRSANELIEEIARKTGGLIWDEETRELFTPDSWHNSRLSTWKDTLPDLSSQVTIHLYNDGDYQRAITLGMSKVGLPDAVVAGFPWSDQKNVGNVLDSFIQSMAESESLRLRGNYKLILSSIRNTKVRETQVKGLGSNGLGVACLTLKEGKWEDGDPHNQLIELTADTYPGTDSHEKQDRMLSSLFGWEDSIRVIKHNDELLAASAKAKAKLPELHQAFSRGLEPAEYIQVKAPFQTPEGDREWMWVEVATWNGDKIKGPLMNEPSNVPLLKAGQIVEVNEQEVFDYIRYYADKRQEGNTTGEIIRKMNEQEHWQQKNASERIMTGCGRLP